MTVAELYAQVAALGFETSLESSEVFYNAAVRAVLEVNRIRPRIASVTLDHVSPENLIDDVFTPKYVKGELNFIAGAPRCAYFEYNGNGRVFFEEMGEDGAFIPFFDEEIRHEGVGFTEYRVILGEKTGLVRMRIVGDYVFSIRNVAMYEDLWGSEREDVPKRGAYTAYDMREIAEDFLEFNTPPVAEEDGYMSAEDYRIEGGTVLLLPYDKPGAYKVLYKRLPRKINGEDSLEDSTEVIDLDDELAALLPPLIAAYVYAEDEPDRSEYYMSLYRQSAAEIRATMRKASVVAIKNKSGW